MSMPVQVSKHMPICRSSRMPTHEAAHIFVQMPVHMSVHRFTRLSIHMDIKRLADMPVHRCSVHMPMHMSRDVSKCISINMSVNTSGRMPIRMPVQRSVHMFRDVYTLPGDRTRKRKRVNSEEPKKRAREARWQLKGGIWLTGAENGDLPAQRPLCTTQASNQQKFAAGNTINARSE